MPIVRSTNHPCTKGQKVWYIELALNLYMSYVYNMEIEKIVAAIRAKRIRITDHADEEAQADKLKYEEVYFSVLNGEIIEDYPKDKPYLSCLIYGQTFAGEPVHSVWAYNQ